MNNRLFIYVLLGIGLIHLPSVMGIGSVGVKPSISTRIANLFTRKPSSPSVPKLGITAGALKSPIGFKSAKSPDFNKQRVLSLKVPKGPSIFTSSSGHKVQVSVQEVQKPKMFSGIAPLRRGAVPSGEKVTKVKGNLMLPDKTKLHEVYTINLKSGKLAKVPNQLVAIEPVPGKYHTQGGMQTPAEALTTVYGTAKVKNNIIVSPGDRKQIPGYGNGLFFKNKATGLLQPLELSQVKP